MIDDEMKKHLTRSIEQSQSKEGLNNEKISVYSSYPHLSDEEKKEIIQENISNSTDMLKKQRLSIDAYPTSNKGNA